MFVGPNIVTDGLVLALDAGSKKSYPGSGTTWYDISGNNFNFTLDGSGITHDSNGYFTLADGGASCSSNITDSINCTFVFWIKTTDEQSLFWQGPTTSTYLGAYRSGNKEYYNGFGTGIQFCMDTIDTPNIYDNIRDNQWHMLEFKNVDMSGINSNNFNQYGSSTFGSGEIGIIQLYNKNLTTIESQQNYNALKSRFI
jgi:hypothetical protein